MTRSLRQHFSSVIANIGISLTVMGCLLTPTLPAADQKEEPQAKEEGKKEDPALVAARQNPLLRNYFKKLYRGNQEYFADDPLFPRPDPQWNAPRDRFLESLVDQQIDNFIGEVREKTSALRKDLSDVKSARNAFIAADREDRNKARSDWRDALKRLEDQAGDLRGMLSLIMTDFDSKSDFKMKWRGDSKADGFASETESLEDELTKAEQRISDYFLSPTYVVNVAQLKGDSMLGLLYRVEEMSKKIRENLRNPG